MKRFIITTTLLIALVGSVFAKPKMKDYKSFKDGSWMIDYVVYNVEVSAWSDSLEDTLAEAYSEHCVTTDIISTDRIGDDFKELIAKYNYIVYSEWVECAQVVEMNVMYIEDGNYKMATWYMD